MKSYKILSVLLIMLCAELFMGTVMAKDKVFTNQDIEKYKKPSDSEPQSTKIDRTIDKTSERREKAEKIKEEREQEYWCKKATVYKRRIEKAQDKVEEAEKELSELQNAEPLTSIQKKRATEKKIKELQKKLERGRKQLKYAERDLSDLEEEAHRKRIPPGWLRCQFE